MLERLIELIREIGAILPGDFTFSHGGKSKFYFDGRKVSAHPEARDIIARLVLRAAEPGQFDYVGGPATGAISIATSVSQMLFSEYKLAVPTFYVRDHEKGHGTRQYIEGIVEPNSRVLVVEDTISTGTSVLNTVRVLEGVNCDIVKIVAFAHWANFGGLSYIRQQGYHCYVMIDLEELAGRQ